MSLLGGIGAHLNKSFTNAVTGVTFNQDAFDEAHARPLKLSEHSEDSTPDSLTEEEWSNLTKGGPRVHDQVDLRNEFEVTESPAVAMKHLGIKITQAAVEKAAEAADVGQEYAKFALEYIAAEARRPTPLSSTEAESARTQAPTDSGWITTCNTIIEVISIVKQRFPSLKDIEAAYKKGRQASKEERRVEMPSYKLCETEAPPNTRFQPPKARTRSQVIDKSPCTDPPRRKGKRVDSTNHHDSFEDVPLKNSSDDDYDADIEIDEQEDELYNENSTKRYFNKGIAGGKVEDDTMKVDNEDERKLDAEHKNAEESIIEQKGPTQLSDIGEDSSGPDSTTSKHKNTGGKGYYSKYVAQRWK